MRMQRAARLTGSSSGLAAARADRTGALAQRTKSLPRPVIGLLRHLPTHKPTHMPLRIEPGPILIHLHIRAPTPWLPSSVRRRSRHLPPLCVGFLRDLQGAFLQRPHLGCNYHTLTSIVKKKSPPRLQPTLSMFHEPIFPSSAHGRRFCGPRRPPPAPVRFLHNTIKSAYMGKPLRMESLRGPTSSTGDPYILRAHDLW